MTLEQHLGFVLCVILSSFLQNITGFALGLMLMGLIGILHLVPLPDAAVAVSFLSVLNAVLALRSKSVRTDRTVIAPTLGASLVGVALGVLLLNWLSDNVVAGLRLLLGVTIVGCAATLLLRSQPIARMSSRRSFAFFGLSAGVLGGLFSTPGPPLVYHLYRQPMDPREIRHTLLLVFGAGSLLRLLMLAAQQRIGLEAVYLSLEAAPMVVAVNAYMTLRPPGWSIVVVKRIVCALLGLVGLGLVLPALQSLWLQMA